MDQYKSGFCIGPFKYPVGMEKKKQEETSPPDQNHPLYASDRDRVDALLGHKGHPNEDQLTTAAMLLNRYDGFQGAMDLQGDLKLGSTDLLYRTDMSVGLRPAAIIRGLVHHLPGGFCLHRHHKN